MAKKIGKFEYYTKSKVSVKADIKIATRDGQLAGKFYLEIPEFDISLENTDIDLLQLEARRLLDEKTSIVWKKYIHIELEGKTTAEMGHYNPMVKINLEVKPFKQGANYKGVIYNTLGSGMREGDILSKCGFVEETTNKKNEYGFHPDDSFNRLFFFGCDKMRSVIEDTEENWKSINKIVADFEAVLQRLYVMFNQNNIHKTLAGNLNFLTNGDKKLLKPKDE